MIAGGGVAVAQRWDDLGENARIAVMAVAATAFLIAGIVARSSQEPAFQRLCSVTWLISTGGAGWAVGLVADTTFELDGSWVSTTAAAATAAYATVLWLFHKRALQHLALFGVTLWLLNSLVFHLAVSNVTETFYGETDTYEKTIGWPFAVVTWAFGVGWVIGAWRRLIEPKWIAVPLGIVAALIAPTLIDTSDAAVYALGLGTAAAVMGLAVASRHSVALAIGAVGLFGYVTGAVIDYFGDTLGVPAALALTGIVILAFSLLAARLIRYTQRSSGPTRPERSTPDA